MQLLSHFFIVCTYPFFHFVECLLNMSIYFCDLSPEESLAEPLMIKSNLYHQSNALIHDCNLIPNTLTDHHGWPTKHLSHMWKKYFEGRTVHFGSAEYVMKIFSHSTILTMKMNSSLPYKTLVDAHLTQLTKAYMSIRRYLNHLKLMKMMTILLNTKVNLIMTKIILIS